MFIPPEGQMEILHNTFIYNVDFYHSPCHMEREQTFRHKTASSQSMILINVVKLKSENYLLTTNLTFIKIIMCLEIKIMASPLLQQR